MTQYWLCLCKLEYVGICMKEGLWGVHADANHLLKSTNPEDKALLYAVPGRSASDRTYQHGYGFIFGVFELVGTPRPTPQHVAWARECPTCVGLNRISNSEGRIGLDVLASALGIALRDIRARLEGEDMITLSEEQFGLLERSAR